MSLTDWVNRFDVELADALVAATIPDWDTVWHDCLAALSSGVDRYRAISAGCGARMRAKEKELAELVGHPFNPCDCSQVAAVIYVELGCSLDTFNSSGDPSVADKVLEKIEHPVARGIIEYRRLSGMKNNADGVMRSAVTIKAAPLTGNYAGVGGAFDYAMRMRLAQINRGMLPAKSLAQGGKLMAESGICGDRKRQRFIKDFWRKWEVAVGQDSVDSLLSDCLVLSNMEAVCRSGRDLGNDVIFSVDSRDVEDLRNLVGLLDSREWRAETSCVLNPTFGASSRLVGGADADIVIDGTLFDIKATKRLDLSREYLRQIVGYYALNLREGDVYNLRAVGIYFARHGVAVSMRCHAAALTWTGLESSLKEYARSLR